MSKYFNGCLFVYSDCVNAMNFVFMDKYVCGCVDVIGYPFVMTKRGRGLVLIDD